MTTKQVNAFANFQAPVQEKVFGTNHPYGLWALYIPKDDTFFLFSNNSYLGMEEGVSVRELMSRGYFLIFIGAVDGR